MSFRFLRRIVIVLAFLGLPLKASAQEALKVGARVRVVEVATSDELAAGELVRLDQDSVVVRSDGEAPAGLHLGAERHLELRVVFAPQGPGSLRLGASVSF